MKPATTAANAATTPVPAQVGQLAQTNTARNHGIGSISEMHGGNINIINIYASSSENIALLAERVASILKRQIIE